LAPFVVNGGETLKSLSAAFLADLEEDWREHGKVVIAALRKKEPGTYFRGMVALCRVMRWDSVETGVSDRSLSPDQVMDRLEERVGPKGRKLFEKFLREVNQLQPEQQSESPEE
jgi:hypothetical protein